MENKQKIHNLSPFASPRAVGNPVFLFQKKSSNELQSPRKGLSLSLKKENNPNAANNTNNSNSKKLIKLESIKKKD